MPHYLEFDGINVEKAIEKACKDLNLKKEELCHDIISYGSSGIFGLVGTKKAKIRVAVQDIEKEISHADVNIPEEKLSGSLVCDEQNENGYIEKGLDILKKILNKITDGAKTSVRIEGKDIYYALLNTPSACGGVSTRKRGFGGKLRVPPSIIRYFSSLIPRPLAAGSFILT